MTAHSESQQAAVQTHHGKVAWVETDAGGRIHFTAAFRWAEVAEHALHSRVSPPLDMGRFPRRSVQATYHRALTFGDEFDLRLRPQEVGNSSITYEWEVVSCGQLAIEGTHTIVHVNEIGQPAPLPEQLRALLGQPARPDS